jgi:hypothetical protein
MTKPMTTAARLRIATAIQEALNAQGFASTWSGDRITVEDSDDQPLGAITLDIPTQAERFFLFHPATDSWVSDPAAVSWSAQPYAATWWATQMGVEAYIRILERDGIVPGSQLEVVVRAEDGSELRRLSGY